MAIDPNLSNFGAFLPTTSVFDVGEVSNTNVKDPNQLRELLVRLYQNLNNMSLAINVKESALYDNSQEFVTGAQFFPDPANNSGTDSAPAMRNTYRTVVNFGTLPVGGASISIPHGLTLTSGFSFTRIYGAATNTSALLGVPITYADGTNYLGLTVDGTNVTIKAVGTYPIGAVAWSTFTMCNIVIEYMKF
jgi:hypothetical protein